jgi:outer membrane lipoprotein-sorting protein
VIPSIDRFLEELAMRPTRGLHAVLVATLILTPTFARAGAAPEAKPSAKLHGTDAVAALPRYVRPTAYSEDMVIRSKGQDLTMRTFYDGAKKRTEMSAQGHDMVTIQPDASGTVYMVMPEQKHVMKYKIDAKDMPPAANDTLGAVPADFDVEALGADKVGDVPAKKFRITSKEGSVLSWFDAASGAPLRMETDYEGETASIEWKNRAIGPQAAELFEVPKGYEVTDMSAMMGGMGGMGAGAMAKGMGAGMVGGMAQSFGGGLGSSIGGMLGGPLGAIAGQYIGGKIGGAVAKKATNAVMN